MGTGRRTDREDSTVVMPGDMNLSTTGIKLDTNSWAVMLLFAAAVWSGSLMESLMMSGALVSNGRVRL